MKSLSYAIMTILSIFISQWAIAAPQDYSQAQNSNTQMERRDREERFRKEHGERYRINISIYSEHHRGGRSRSDWKVGAPIPENYRYTDYAVDYQQYPQLPEPSRYQQWIKVDNRFILINVLTNTTLRVVPDTK